MDLRSVVFLEAGWRRILKDDLPVSHYILVAVKLMDCAEIEFASFTQNEVLGLDGLAFGALGFGGLIWKTCVCHCALSDFDILLVALKGGENAQNEKKRCLFSLRCLGCRARKSEKAKRITLYYSLTGVPYDNQEAKER